MTTWTIERVAARFEEAVLTLQRLPSVRLQGYVNTWPAIRRQRWERLCVEDKVLRFAPDPKAITRLEETLTWVNCLDVDARHLVWMRAEQEPWREICARLGCDRTTAWRRWQKALSVIAASLASPTTDNLRCQPRHTE
jgi:hypothetical protein